MDELRCEEGGPIIGRTISDGGGLGRLMRRGGKSVGLDRGLGGFERDK
jgi:hypothetical protein